MKISARNQLKGVVKSVTEGAVNGIVSIEIADGKQISATISMSSIKELGLADETILVPNEDAEARVLALTKGRGADGVVEAAGGEDTFTLAWKIARPNSVVALVAMYESTQSLPLPDMYGKNLIFKTGGVDATHCEEFLQLMAAGMLRTDFLITHKAPLNDILEGYRVFSQHLDGCMKWAVTPFEKHRE